jgi:hypothetical protein
MRKEMIMKYVWINPVTDRMYEKEILDTFIRKHGYERVEITKDWLKTVREKYGEAVERSEKPVIDARCPMAVELVKKEICLSDYELPAIEPILLHCGREIAERKMEQADEIIITTPCQALADQGNDLGYEHVRFLPWNRFLEELMDAPCNRIFRETPIPLGFFDKLNVDTVSLTGESEILTYFQKNIEKEPALIEMLYCEGGCHKGDGIL